MSGKRSRRSSSIRRGKGTGKRRDSDNEYSRRADPPRPSALTGWNYAGIREIRAGCLPPREMIHAAKLRMHARLFKEIFNKYLTSALFYVPRARTFIVANKINSRAIPFTSPPLLPPRGEGTRVNKCRTLSRNVRWDAKKKRNDEKMAKRRPVLLSGDPPPFHSK